MVLRKPKAVIAFLIGKAGKLKGISQGIPDAGALRDGRLVENAKEEGT